MKVGRTAGFQKNWRFLLKLVVIALLTSAGDCTKKQEEDVANDPTVVKIVAEVTKPVPDILFPEIFPPDSRTVSVTAVVAQGEVTAKKLADIITGFDQDQARYNALLQDFRDVVEQRFTYAGTFGRVMNQLVEYCTDHAALEHMRDQR